MVTTSTKKQANTKKEAAGAAQRTVEDLGQLLDAMDEEDKEHRFTNDEAEDAKEAFS